MFVYPHTRYVQNSAILAEHVARFWVTFSYLDL